MASMQRIAAGDFTARLERSYDGSESDVLAFLINTLAEEVGALVGALRDEREALQTARDRIAQTEKLAGLGMLAGGVAHEMNQPLSVIRSLTEIMLMNPDTPIRDHLDDVQLIESAANRMSKIVDSIRSFGRAQPFELRAIDPMEPLRAALELMGEPLRQRTISVVESVSPELPTILADSDRLQQVFINLLANARDAVTPQPADKRIIEIGVEWVGDTLRYTVADSGPGIPPDIVARIFDPFYTTKQPGEGTGLGLSVSLGIVQDHNGELQYGPSETGGARFTAEIPVFTPRKSS